jgi:hypothetical protein
MNFSEWRFLRNSVSIRMLTGIIYIPVVSYLGTCQHIYQGVYPQGINQREPDLFELRLSRVTETRPSSSDDSPCKPTCVKPPIKGGGYS